VAASKAPAPAKSDFSFKEKEKTEDAKVVEKKKKEDSEFEAALKSKLQKQSAEAQARAAQKEEVEGVPRPIRGSREEALEVERKKAGASVSNRLPFKCERCNWGSAATAIRQCRRCGWCEQGSKEEAEAWEQAKEREKFRDSRKQDEVGAVDEDGGVEDEKSVRGFKFQCRMMYTLDDDSPGWLEAVREKHYGGPKTEKHKKYTGVDIEGKGVAPVIEDAPKLSKEELRKQEEQERVMPLPVKGLPSIEPLD
jgi:hypothetical protein